MEWTIAVVDDLQSDRDSMAESLQAQLAGEALNLRTFADASLFLADFRPGTYQLVFLDICMEGMDGVTLAERLRAADEKLLIVFLTSSPEYVFDVQRFHPFDYLLKPCQNDALKHVLDEARRVLDTPEPELVIRADRSDYRIPFSQITAALSQGHNVEIRTLSGHRLMALSTFREVEDTLTQDPRFLLCNRGIIVNMDHISSCDGTTFRVKDGNVYPMRVRQQRDLTARFSQYQISHLRGRMK